MKAKLNLFPKLTNFNNEALMTILEELQQAINQAVSSFLTLKKGYKNLKVKDKQHVDTLISFIDMKKNPSLNSDAQLLRDALKTYYDKSLKPSVFGVLFDAKGLHAKVFAILESAAFQPHVIDAKERTQIKTMDWYGKLETLTLDLQKKTEETGLYVARVQALQTQCNDFQTKYQKLLNENTAFEKKIQALEEKIALLSNESVLHQKLNELEQKVNTQNEVITNLLEENKLLNGEKTHMERRLTLMEAERDDYQAKYEALLSNYQKLFEEQTHHNPVQEKNKVKKKEKIKTNKTQTNSRSQSGRFFDRMDETKTTPKEIPPRKNQADDNHIPLSSFNNL